MAKTILYIVCKNKLNDYQQRKLSKITLAYKADIGFQSKIDPSLKYLHKEDDKNCSDDSRTSTIVKENSFNYFSNDSFMIDFDKPNIVKVIKNT